MTRSSRKPAAPAPATSASEGPSELDEDVDAEGLKAGKVTARVERVVRAGVGVVSLSAEAACLGGCVVWESACVVVGEESMLVLPPWLVAVEEFAGRPWTVTLWTLMLPSALLAAEPYMRTTGTDRGGRSSTKSLPDAAEDVSCEMLIAVWKRGSLWPGCTPTKSSTRGPASLLLTSTAMDDTKLALARAVRSSSRNVGDDAVATASAESSAACAQFE
jgi:hypothetical protein